MSDRKHVTRFAGELLGGYLLGCGERDKMWNFD